MPGTGVAAAIVAVLVVLLVPTRLVFGRFFGLVAVGLALAVAVAFGAFLRADVTARSEGVRWYTPPPQVELPEELPEVAPSPAPQAAAPGEADGPEPQTGETVEMAD